MSISFLLLCLLAQNLVAANEVEPENYVRVYPGAPTAIVALKKNRDEAEAHPVESKGQGIDPAEFECPILSLVNPENESEISVDWDECCITFTSKNYEVLKKLFYDLLKASTWQHLVEGINKRKEDEFAIKQMLRRKAALQREEGELKRKLADIRHQTQERIQELADDCQVTPQLIAALARDGQGMKEIRASLKVLQDVSPELIADLLEAGVEASQIVENFRKTAKPDRRSKRFDSMAIPSFYNVTETCTSGSLSQRKSPNRRSVSRSNSVGTDPREVKSPTGPKTPQRPKSGHFKLVSASTIVNSSAPASPLRPLHGPPSGKTGPE
jgi:hypothetical protein